MDYQPRTIALLTELHHPGQPTDPRPVQKLHNQMFEGATQPVYTSFAVTPVGPVLSNPVSRPGAVSQVAFLQDRFQFREELGSLTAESFGQRVREIAEQVAELRPIQVFTGQQITLRTLVNPRNFRDARTFLKEGMFGFAGQTEALGREPQLYGLRLVFPPEKKDSHAFAVRIESYSNDPRSLFVEIQGTFGPVLVARGLEALEARVLEAYEFLTRRVLAFVARFDARQEA
ncbi:MAG: hypothetical protein ACI8QZ_002692 [Chlamydiales bacterium]|jgi:hypothetical protein